MDRYVIEYDYSGTVSGKSVGKVFAWKMSDAIPGYPDVGWTYSKDPDEATWFPSAEDAEAAIVGKHWPNAKVVQRADGLLGSESG